MDQWLSWLIASQRLCNAVNNLWTHRRVCCGAVTMDAAIMAMVHCTSCDVSFQAVMLHAYSHIRFPGSGDAGCAGAGVSNRRSC